MDLLNGDGHSRCTGEAAEFISLLPGAEESKLVHAAVHKQGQARHEEGYSSNINTLQKSQ